MLYILKRIIKKILRSLGFKLIRIGPPYKSNPYGKIDLETLDCINISFYYEKELEKFFYLILNLINLLSIFT